MTRTTIAWPQQTSVPALTAQGQVREVVSLLVAERLPGFRHRRMVVKGGAAVAQRPQALDAHSLARTLNCGEDNCLPLPSGERPVSTAWTGWLRRAWAAGLLRVCRRRPPQG